jgi:hypothetical protein
LKGQMAKMEEQMSEQKRLYDQMLDKNIAL